MPGVMECSCGHRMVLERPEDAPYCCPKCGGGKIPETMSRQAQRRAKAEFAKAKIKLGPKVRSELDKLSEQMAEFEGVKELPVLLEQPIRTLTITGIGDPDPEPAA